MAKYTTIQKNRLLKKLKEVNVINEKDILNIKVSDLQKINEKSKLTIIDIEIIWLIQEAINKKSLLDFFADTN